MKKEQAVSLGGLIFALGLVACIAGFFLPISVGSIYTGEVVNFSLVARQMKVIIGGGFVALAGLTILMAGAIKN